MKTLLCASMFAMLAGGLSAQTSGASSPSAAEQLAIYEINRARANPQAYEAEHSAEFATYNTDLVGVLPQPPLAINENLVNSAQFHSNEMAANGYFAHTSAVTGDQPNLMARNAGYPLNPSWPDAANYMESLYVRYTSGGSISATAPNAILALIIDDGVPSLGHRKHLLAMTSHNQLMREIGAGYAEGLPPTGTGAGAYWTIHTGYRGSANDTPFLTGVVYNDVNGNGRYDLNEGIGGAIISITGAMNTSTTANGEGGWAIRLTSVGSFNLTCNGGSFVGTSTASTTVGSDNIAIDFISGNPNGIVGFVGSTGGGTGGSGGGSNSSSSSSGGGGGGCSTQGGNSAWAMLGLLLSLLGVLGVLRLRVRA